MEMDIIHLLPPVPRGLLYCYPTPNGRNELRDCHWTCLNFFEEQPNDAFLDVKLVARKLQDAYETVPEATRLGDVLLFTLDGSNIIHSCVYVADDVVFTKNGANVMQPWTLMRRSEVISCYPTDPPLNVVVKRRKP